MPVFLSIRRAPFSPKEGACLLFSLSAPLPPACSALCLPFPPVDFSPGPSACLSLSLSLSLRSGPARAGTRKTSRPACAPTARPYRCIPQWPSSPYSPIGPLVRLAPSALLSVLSLDFNSLPHGRAPIRRGACAVPARPARGGTAPASRAAGTELSGDSRSPWRRDPYGAIWIDPDGAILSRWRHMIQMVPYDLYGAVIHMAP